MFDLAIVGAGFSGTLTAVHLLRTARAPFAIALIERRPEPGLGVAYSTTTEGHLLNVPAAGMSAFPDQPGHFLAWLEAETGRKPLSPFVPRTLYGRYLQHLLAEAEANAAPGVTLERRHGDVVGLRAGPDGVTLTLEQGESLDARRVVLALGHFPPADPKVSHGSDFYRSPRYAAEPWAPSALEGLTPGAPVLLIGSGLTAIDLALALVERGHRGTIHMLSRRGQLPHPHRLGMPPAPMDGWKALPPKVSAWLPWLRAEVERLEAEGGDWRQAMDGLRPQVQALWHGLSEPERRRFLRHVRPFWEIHRHRMAPEVGEALTMLRAIDRLYVHAGRLVAFEERENEVLVALRPRGSEKAGVLSVGRVINCTGPECDFRKMRHPLLASLLEQGLIRPDPLGMGLDVTEDGRVVDAFGQASERLYAIGPLRKGRLWETTAVPELRGQAAAVAELVLQASEQTAVPADRTP
jgi:uncharacterized NAD(P)/FAD-binding protein YdhS